MPVRDYLLNLSPADSDLPLIATNVMSANTVDLKGTPLRGMAVRLNLGYTLGNTAVLTGTFNVVIHAASSTPVSSSDPVIGQLDAPIVASSEAAGTTVEKIIPIDTNYRYIRAEFQISGLAASDSPAFSQVEAYVVLKSRDWSREVDF